jgi:hypothetical protein
MEDSPMKKLALAIAATVALGSAAVTTNDAQAQGYYGGYHRGYAYGPRYVRHRRGIGPGAAIGLGIAGLAAGAIVANQARHRYYDDGYYDAPRAYGPAYGGYYGPY